MGGEFTEVCPRIVGHEEEPVGDVSRRPRAGGADDGRTAMAGRALEVPGVDEATGRWTFWGVHGAVCTLPLRDTACKFPFQGFALYLLWGVMVKCEPRLRVPLK